MSTKASWRYATASATGSIAGSIAHVGIVGIVTPSVSADLLGDNADWIQSLGAFGQVAIYDSAMMMLDPHRMLANARASANVNRALEVPTALLVRPEQLELFTTYALMMLEHGIVRAAFDRYEPALAWAQQQAVIHEACAPMRRQPVAMPLELSRTHGHDQDCLAPDRGTGNGRRTARQGRAPAVSIDHPRGRGR